MSPCPSIHGPILSSISTVAHVPSFAGLSGGTLRLPEVQVWRQELMEFRTSTREAVKLHLTQSSEAQQRSTYMDLPMWCLFLGSMVDIPIRKTPNAKRNHIGRSR